MLASKAPLLLFLLLLGPAVQSTSDVLELRGFGALQEAAKDYKLLAVEFYAPWCRHCKRLEPEWAKAATELKSQHADAGIKLARIDATDDFNSDVVAKFGIKGYPTINTILHGDVDHPQDYGGPRDAPGITAYLLKQLAPAEKKLGPGNTTDELAQVLEEAEVAVVAFLPSEEGAEHVAFKAMAERLKFEMASAYVLERSLLEECGDRPDCDSAVAIMTKKGSKKKPRYEGTFTEELLVAWAQSHAAPLVARYSEDQNQFADFMRAWKVALPQAFFITEKEADLTPKAMQVMQEAAEANEGIKFFVASRETGQKLIEYLGLPESADTPFFFIHDHPIRTKYLKTGVKIVDLPEFLREFQEGALPPYVKSEEPLLEQEGPVTVVTGSTYKQLVLNSTKATAMYFFAPWCAHCRRFTSTWGEVAEALEDDERLLVAKLDVSKNDIPDPRIEITGLPAIYFLERGSGGKAHKFEGPRYKDKLLKFAHEHLGDVPADKEAEAPAAAPAPAPAEDAAKQEL